ncbi:class I SAM-dependent methyltransferase [Microbacterium sp. CIAB417]|uniref:class I SAM-dependent methyltransferase n=1 Tax=Microbacterium sp. CIAB417 TaxID=2860287 RepID=UPI001FAE0B59|nr:class I SAM-dependent methyltransferase [Microbacterium sp. CIAB417]
MTDASISAAYDSRATDYVDVAGSIEQMDAADRRLIAAWRDATPGALLDAGCGPGHWTRFLRDGGRDVVGVDLSERFLATALARHPELRFERASLRALPFRDASFGGILAWYSLIHTPPAELPAIVAELARVHAPGGSLLIGYFEGTPGEPFAHAVTTAYFWDAESLGILLRDAGFTVTAHERRERVAGEPSTRPHGSVVAVRHGIGEIA